MDIQALKERIKSLDPKAHKALIDALTAKYNRLAGEREDVKPQAEPAPDPSVEVKNFEQPGSGKVESAYPQKELDQIHVKAGSRTPTEYLPIARKEDLIEAVSKFEKAERIAVDTETTSLDPYSGKIRLIQIAIPDHPVMILDLFKINPGDLTPLVELFQSSMEKIFQNAKFDLKMLKMAGIPVEGNLFDTMIAAQLLASGLKVKGFSLSEIAKEYLDESLPKEEQMSDWSGELSSTQFEYAAKDAEILLRIKDVLQKKLVQENLQKVALLEFGCVPAVAEMELNGMLLDLEKWNNLSKELNASQGKLEAILHEELGDINLNSHVQLLRTLKARGIPIENTRRETLSLWVDKNPVLKQVLDYCVL